MSEKVTVYENKDLFQQLCNCCPISIKPIKNYKLDITLSNGQNQVLRLCDEHLNELGKAIKNLKVEEGEKMSEKVKVSREVAEALELARVIRSDETITNMCISKSFVADQEPLNNLNPYIMVKILISGYEIELTPEEDLVRHYKECTLSNTIGDKTYAKGIKKAVEILGLKIKGINQ